MIDLMKGFCLRLLNNLGYEIKAKHRRTSGPEDGCIPSESNVYGPAAEKCFFATQLLYSRITPELHEKFSAFLRRHPEFDLDSPSVPAEHRVREVLRLGNFYLKEDFNPLTGLAPFNPPDNIHAMVREEVYCGDLYYCDLITEALDASGLELVADGKYLDFGCSSGRVVRTLAITYPESKFFGCDPNAEAIQWAQAAIPNVEMFVSPESPPLPLGDAVLDGAYAISIWSHFSIEAALLWLDEMHRVIKSNGWLLVTTHGFGSLNYYFRHKSMLVGEVEYARRELNSVGYYFIDVFGNEGDWGVGKSNWGQFFINPAYFIQTLQKKWALLYFRPARSEGNQDVYLLARR